MNKIILYIKLFIRSRYFIIPLALYISLSIPNIFRLTQSKTITYTTVQKPESITIKTTSESFFDYAEHIANYPDTNYIVQDNITELQLAVDLGIKGVYKLNFVNNSEAVVVLIKNNLDLYDSKPTYKNKKGDLVRIITNGREVFVSI